MTEYSRRIDDLGRIVLPGELRRELGWKERDALYIKRHSDTQVIIEKAYPTCFICGERESLVEIGHAHICAACRCKLRDAKDGDIIAIENRESTE